MAKYLTKFMRSMDGRAMRRAFFGALRDELLTAARLTPRRPMRRALSAAGYMGVGAATTLGVLAFVPSARRMLIETSEGAASDLKRVANEASAKLRAALGPANTPRGRGSRQMGRSSTGAKGAGRNGRMRRAVQHP